MTLPDNRSRRPKGPLIAIFAGLAIVALAVALPAPAPALDTSPKAQLEQTIAEVGKKWPDIKHLAADEVTKMMSDKSAAVFDVRSAEEYAVSHLEGAIRVDPAMTADDFLKQHGAAVKGKNAVFYCSVGMRSSRLTERVAPSLKTAGAASYGELKGGIFAWAGDKRPLVDAKGATDKVHGFDASWGKLVVP